MKHNWRCSWLLTIRTGFESLHSHYLTLQQVAVLIGLELNCEDFMSKWTSRGVASVTLCLGSVVAAITGHVMIVPIMLFFALMIHD